MVPKARATLLPAALLAAGVLIAYATTLPAPFLFDDLDAVVRNTSLRQLWSWAVLLPPADGSATTGRPLVNLSFALNHAISGLDAWSYHAANLVIHAGAALALFGLVRRTLAGPVLATRFGPAAAPLAFSVALLWALHPLQTESVTCIAQRTESLCGLFYLLTLYAFARATAGGAGWAVGAVAAGCAGMATKEVMVTAPLVALLLDRTFFAGSFAAAWARRRRLHLALAGSWVILAALLADGGGSRGHAAGFGLGVTPWQYLLQQCEALVRYAWLTVWPHPLVLDYGSGVARSLVDVWWQAPLVLAALGWTAWALARRPVAGFLGGWFFVILAPSSSVVPLVTQTMAEHRMYLPLAAPLAAAVGMLWGRPGVTAPWLLAALALPFAASTLARNRDYRDPVRIWSRNVAARPDGARGHNHLAVALHAAGRSAEADPHFLRALALERSYVSAHYNRGAMLLDLNRPAEAIAPLAAAVELAPDHADARLNLGAALSRAGRPAEAIPHLERALQVRPAADVHYNLGVLLADTERAEAAERHLREALRLSPGLFEADYQLGRLAERRADLDAALAHYAAALRLAPEHPGAHRRSGLLLARRGDLAAAADHFSALVRATPSDADAHANLGNVRLLQGLHRDAVARFEEALRLRPGDARLRESLELARRAGR